MDQVTQVLEMFAALLPDWLWPYADTFFSRAVPWVLGAAALVFVIDKYDLRDGRRDIPVIGVVVPYVSLLLEFLLAVLALVGVRVPGWKDLVKFKELVQRVLMLRGSPSTEDVRGEK